jgi:small subunit ribosomal protein S2
MVVIDMKKEALAVREARRLKITVIGLVDTNCDPDDADFIIPGNDDAIRSAGLIIRVLADAVAEGQMKVKAAEFEAAAAAAAIEAEAAAAVEAAAAESGEAAAAPEPDSLPEPEAAPVAEAKAAPEQPAAEPEPEAVAVPAAADETTPSEDEQSE